MPNGLEYISKSDERLGTDYSQRLACYMLIKRHAGMQLSTAEQDFLQQQISLDKSGKLQQAVNNITLQSSVIHLQEFILSDPMSKLKEKYGISITDPSIDISTTIGVEGSKTPLSKGPKK
jgi:3-deoxy-D-arabino-heptulosonate 7-phosphate (DAHP) synthase